MIFNNYVNHKCEFVVIESVFDDIVLYTKLQKRDMRPLYEVINDYKTKNHELFYIEGEKCPIKLFTGWDYQYSSKFDGHWVEWYINYRNYVKNVQPSQY